MSAEEVIKYISRRKLFTENNEYNEGYILLFTIASSMIWIMVPGLAFLYSGLARRKSALSMIWIVIMSSFVGIFQWYFWGYSLAFSDTSNNSFIGDLHFFGFKNLLGASDDKTTYPDIAYSLFQLQFLLEGIMITSIGGIIGYVTGVLIAMLISNFLPFKIYTDWTAVALTVGVSVFIGIVFSVFPAKSAANKDVIEILR